MRSAADFSITDLATWLQGGETDLVEFKREWFDLAAKEGKALAPELHEQILEMALKALAGEDAADADDAKKRSDPDKASDADASASGSPEGNQRSSSVGQ